MGEKMKAAVFYERERMEIEDVDIPVINESEVLIKVKACGICGSDVSYYYGKSPVETPTGKGPLILGHEISGDVVEAGREAKKFCRPGDRVTLNPPQPCGSCVYCRMARPNLCGHTKTVGVSVNGGFAEYVKAGYANVVKIPPSADYLEAAMAEPLACACYGVKKLDVQAGDFVAVIGSGSIGLMMAQLVKLRGAAKVLLTGTTDFRLETAKKIGVDYVYNTRDDKSPRYSADIGETVRELSGGLGAGRVIVPVASGTAYRDAFRVSAKASTIVFFGLPGEKDIIEVPALETLTGDKSVLFAWLAPYTWNTAMAALSSGAVQFRPLITHTFPLEKTREGIEFMHSRVTEKIKGMVVTGETDHDHP
jgi:L-iditol 2-dehydrogenase